MSGQSGGGDGGGSGRIRLANLNDQLTCKLCNGYFIDATTIIECLHSFCRSCIVHYLESNKYCPICEVQVHKSKPLLNIRPDHTLQDIVYKLVPGCYQNEMRCRREFYENHPDAQLSTMSPEARGEPIESHIYSPDEVLTLSLEYYNPNYTDTAGVGVVIPLNETKELTAASISSSAGSGAGIGSNETLPRRYLRCPAAVTVFHLQKLIRAKNGLSDVHRVDIMYKEESLCGNYTLMDVMYIYHWRRKVPLHLSYRIFESSPKRLKLSDDNVEYRESLSKTGIDFVPTSTSSTSTSTSSGASTSPTSKDSIKSESKKDEWKEVQLKISETGETSVTVITNSDLKKLSKSGSATYTRASDSQNKNSVKAEPAVDSNSKIKNEDKPKDKSLEESNSKPNNNEASVKPEKDKNKNDKSEATSTTAGGSKIDALSVKLQFQPKVGQVNNTYSKRTPKDKSKVTITENKLLKKSDARLLTDGQKTKAGEKNRGAASSSTPTTPTSKPLTFTLVSFPPQKNTDGDKEPPANKRKNDVNYNQRSGLTITTTTCTSSFSSICTVASGKNSRQNSSNEASAEASAHAQKSSHPLFPYTVQDLVSNAKKSGTKPNESPLHTPTVTYSITTASTTTSSSSSGSGGKTPIYTSPCNNKSNDVNSNSSKINSNSSSNSINNINQSGGSTIIVPPCPDAIPIALMKPTVRKTEILTKGTNLNEICAKIGGNAAASVTNTSSASTGATPSSSSSPSGSKINDICAKIGENTKEKNSRLETKSRPEIPDLLKITKKSMASTNTNDINTNALIKHIANIPNIPIYTPSLSVSELRNNSGSGSTTYSRDYLKMSLSTPSITVTTTTSTSPSTNLTPTTSSITITPASSMVITATSTQQQNSSFQRKRATSKNNTGNNNSGSGTSSMSNYKTLREPPKPWNTSLSKNNYVAAKNQAAKEMQNQTQAINAGSEQSDGKSIASKPAKIFKMRNVPRFLGNPASGVKPMYNIESKDKDSSSSLSATGNTKLNSSGLSMTKIDPKTLSPITITSRANTNSPIITPPPYSPNTSSSYQNTPFSRGGASGSTAGSNTTGINSPLSPRNSPVNLLSTSPFIPSQTPNTNPRLIYTHFHPSVQPPPQYSNADLVRFSTNPLIRTNLSCLPAAPPNAAFHSSLPPAISKFFQRTISYVPHTTTVTYSQQGLASQSVAIQRILPNINNFTTASSSSLTSTSSKTSKTSAIANSQSFNSAKTESNREIGHLIKTTENSAFNLSTAVSTVSTVTTTSSSSVSSVSTSSSSNYASDLSKNSPTKGSDAKSGQSASKNVPCDSSSKGKTDGKEEMKKEDKDKDKDKDKDERKEDKVEDKGNNKDKDHDKTEEVKEQTNPEDDKAEEEINKAKKKVKDEKKPIKRLKKDEEEEKKNDESKEEVKEELKVNGSSTSTTSASAASESADKKEEQTAKETNPVKDDTKAAVASNDKEETNEAGDKEKKSTELNESNNKSKEVKINKSALNSE
ncbi:serine-rich adhesin for platelets-like [Cotesia glomerata]|uniref:RING-type domain-containing protein n=1 Tax=Cotesia glomerata TaxID=32391 RepID=A0AAV7IA71_COTGL|nr:serine-rich adhesin for platelets-like [Cotesia glomerata]KAH0546991.1 hypothetical protein KQX54_016599 [Cotesia glomerata]